MPNYAGLAILTFGGCFSVLWTIIDDGQIYRKKKLEEKERTSTWSENSYELEGISKSHDQHSFKLNGLSRQHMRHELLKV